VCNVSCVMIDISGAQTHVFKKGINPLKAMCICFIQGLGAYRAVNTLHLGYKNQSVNVL
jgi:hypothetical protein